MKVFQHLKAQNDSNGNPRRLYVVYQPGRKIAKVVKVYDEGYRGLPRELHGIPELMSVRIENSKYREIIRRAKETGKLDRG